MVEDSIIIEVEVHGVGGKILHVLVEVVIEVATEDGIAEDEEILILLQEF